MTPVPCRTCPDCGNQTPADSARCLNPECNQPPPVKRQGRRGVRVIAPTVLRDLDCEVSGAVSPYGITIHRVTAEDGTELALTDAEELVAIEALAEAWDEAVRWGGDDEEADDEAA